ncbi:MAG TPA: hypothetical protein PKY59_12990 [Pyrinomonadaceae bacterium]|nr:hypothetical protein [Pyrinomonadaceae bacterium]
MLKFRVYKSIAFVFILCFLCLSAHAQSEPLKPCRFDVNSLSFKGTSLEQADCLLRKVKLQGNLEKQEIPNLLKKLIDQPVSVTKASLKEYLTKNGIKENEIGGSLDENISRGRSNDQNAPFARYFVIHDTSTPNLCEVNEFPANINEADWSFKNKKWNNPKLPIYSDSKDAHLYIMRDGNSVAPQNRTFATPWRATKIEKNDVKMRGMFLHIENVQPRHCNPSLIASGKCRNSKGECVNDNIAPQKGFSDAQLKRLALVYIAASIRRGKWMIPAFHAALDLGISDGHDDPQNFDLQKWSDTICSLIKDLKSECPN